MILIDKIWEPIFCHISCHDPDEVCHIESALFCGKKVFCTCYKNVQEKYFLGGFSSIEFLQKNFFFYKLTN